ncbi:hypothetical protein ACXR0O_04650 [Verrucomicrobiota bacterium sgz303538]
MDRRTFLHSSVLATAGSVTGWTANARTEPSEAILPAPCAPTSWEKRGVILEATEPWEGNSIQNFTTRAEPLEGADTWRIWYSVSGERTGYNVAYAEGIPGEPMKKVPAICSPGEPVEAPLAIGNLPERWKPVQAIHLPLQNGKHRLYFWAHGPQVCRYLVAESEDGRRYRVIDPLRPILYHPNDRAAFGVPSLDGIMLRKDKSTNLSANEPLALPRLISNDATNIYQLPDGSFELYSVALIQVPKNDPAYIAEDNAPGLLRVIDRYTSEDGLHFENRQRVIQRDASDPVDQQFYYLSVTHTPKGRLGMLGHYRCNAQTMDLEWCFSMDGIHWQRLHRNAWIPRGEQSAPDCYGIYAGNQLVQRGDRWHLFYTGVNSSHNGKHAYGKARQVIMLASTSSLWA